MTGNKNDKASHKAVRTDEEDETTTPRDHWAFILAFLVYTLIMCMAVYGLMSFFELMRVFAQSDCPSVTCAAGPDATTSGD